MSAQLELFPRTDTQTIIVGDCHLKMRGMPSDSISCIVTDPPYGLSFMGKKWDYQLPSQAIWLEALRVCKPGAIMLCFGGTRTYHRLTCAIEDAGWEIRDCIMWLYGSGFPKSHNFGRQLGGEWDGYGTALKPAYEPIIVAMKPLDGTYAQNAEKWGVAGINIDACRIPSNGEHKRSRGEVRGESFLNEAKGMYTPGRSYIPTNSDLGRWPANIILDEEAGQALDEMSGESKSGLLGWNPTEKDSGMWKGKKRIAQRGHNDSGGASRFFYCAKASSRERNEGLEGFEEQEKGVANGTKCANSLKGPGNMMNPDKNSKMKNHHPTVKPLALMEYLIKLVMPPKDGVLLDPFAGSGSTLVAAKRQRVNAIGIELSEEYAKIAKGRIEHA